MKKTINVESTFNDMRIDRLIRNYLGKIPQALLEKSLRNGKIKLNYKRVKSSKKVKIGDQINFFNFIFKENIQYKKSEFKPSNEIIKENENLIIENNDDFIVLNKKSGIPVQGGTKSKKNLIDIFSKSKIFQNSKPYSVHRLDKDTSGVFMIAKNRQMAQLLTSLFRLRKVHKSYLAICHGEIENLKGILNKNLVRYENKKKIIENAETIFKVIDKNNSSSLILLKPITGRKHQLRKHLFMIGHSILGDRKYISQNTNKSINKNLMLHSYEIKFMINKKKYTFRASLPEYFKKMLKSKRLSFQY
tara:strand:+ start:464 stop:1375 length:912 start_codon:yes stop_codon:yes gene_type:complete